MEEVIEYRGDTTIVVPRKVLRSVAEQCRDTEELKFNLLTDATAVSTCPSTTASRNSSRRLIIAPRMFR